MEDGNSENKQAPKVEESPELKADRDDALGYTREQIDIEPKKPAAKKSKLKPKKRKFRK